MRRDLKCPYTCECLCHEFGITVEHGKHPRCPTKDGLPLVDVEWRHIVATKKTKLPQDINRVDWEE